MTDLTCGQGGSTGQEIVNRINKLSKLQPRGSMRTAPITVSIPSAGGSPVLVSPNFTEKVTEREGLAVDLAAGTITNNTGNGYSSAILTLGITADFPNNETLHLFAYVNGSPYSANPMAVSGEGNKDGVNMFWQSEFSLAAGDVIDIRAISSDATAFNVDITRATFRLDVDNHEL